MSSRVWAVSLATLLVIAAALSLYSAPPPELRSEHSRRAARVPEQQVAIVDGGKLFHDPACTVMHGKPRMVSAGEAVRLGYTPCTRCMKAALGR